jgi:regulator of sigma E protease
MFELTGYWSLLYQLPVGIIGLSFMVFVHELGHFLAAKSVGVRVHTFSIGFGKKLIRIKRGDTEYCLSMIPFGGYVAMAGENPDEGGYGATDEFQQKSVPARLWIAVAGPLANILFALAVLFGLYLAGVQEPKQGLVVGHVEAGSAGEKAGVKVGDEIIAYAGKPMENWEGFVQEAALSGDELRPLNIVRDGKTEQLELEAKPDPRFGVALTGILGEWEVSIHKLMPGKPAAQAGLKTGDVIERIDGAAVPTSIALIDMINGSKGRTLNVAVRRGSGGQTENLVIPVAPAYDSASKRYLIGVYPASLIPTELVRRDVIESARLSAITTWGHATLVFRTFGKIFTGQVQVKALSGPIGIVQMISGSLQQSLQKFLEFTALLNTNLGIMNLLPLAITDGGLILLLLIEAVRRKPVSAKTQNIISRVGMTFFIALFLFITFQDILRIPMLLN